MSESTFKPHIVSALLLASTLCASPAVLAIATAAHSEAYNVSAGLDVTVGADKHRLLVIDKDAVDAKIASAKGEAPAAYHDNGQVLITQGDVIAQGSVTANHLVNATTNINANLTATILNAEAASDVDGTAGARTVSSTQNITGLNFNLGTTTSTAVLSSHDFITLRADVIETYAKIGYENGLLTRTGGTTLANAFLSIKLNLLDSVSLGSLKTAGLLDSALNLNINLNDALTARTDVLATVDLLRWYCGSNTSLLSAFNALGLSILLNEIDLTTPQAIAVNALHIKFGDGLKIATAPLGLTTAGYLSGDIIIGHTDVAMTIAAGNLPASIPEPASVLLLTLGAMLMKLHRQYI